MLSEMTAVNNTDSSDDQDSITTSNGIKEIQQNGCPTSKRQLHNIVEKKRKDKLKDGIGQIRQLLPDAEFTIKKLTHHEVLQTACEYIQSLKTQNQELLLGKAEEITNSIIQKLKDENTTLKAENRKYRQIIEQAGFPPLADLTQLVLSWKTRSSTVAATTAAAVVPCIDSCQSVAPVTSTAVSVCESSITQAAASSARSSGVGCAVSAPSTVSNSANGNNAAVDTRHVSFIRGKPSSADDTTKRKRRAMTINECLKRRSQNELPVVVVGVEVDSSLNSTLTGEKDAPEYIDSSTVILQPVTASIGPQLTDSGELTPCELSDYDRSSRENAASAARECNGLPAELDGAGEHSGSKERLFPNVREKSSDDASACLSESAASVDSIGNDLPTDVSAVARLATGCNDADTNTADVATSVREQALSSVSSSQTVVDSELSCSKIAPLSFASSVSSALTVSSAVVAVAYTPVLYVCQTGVSSVAVSTAHAHSRKVSMPSSSLSLSSHPVAASACLDGGRSLVSLDVGNDMFGTGLVYGKFIYHNGQLMLSRSRIENCSLAAVQSNRTLSVEPVWQSNSNSTLLRPVSQILPVYTVQQAPSIFTVASSAPDVMIITPAVACPDVVAASSLQFVQSTSISMATTNVPGSVSEILKSVISSSTGDLDPGEKTDESSSGHTALVQFCDDVADNSVTTVKTTSLRGDILSAANDEADVTAEPSDTANSTKLIPPICRASENAVSVSRDSSETESSIPAASSLQSDPSVVAAAADLSTASATEISLESVGDADGEAIRSTTSSKSRSDDIVATVTLSDQVSKADGSTVSAVNSNVSSLFVLGSDLATSAVADTARHNSEIGHVQQQRDSVEPPDIDGTAPVPCRAVVDDAAATGDDSHRSSTLGSLHLPPFSGNSTSFFHSIASYSETVKASSSSAAPQLATTTLPCVDYTWLRSSSLTSCGSVASSVTTTMTLSSSTGGGTYVNDCIFPPLPSLRANKRKSVTTSSAKCSKSRKLAVAERSSANVSCVSQYICPPADPVVCKDKYVPIHLLDRLNSGDRVTAVSCEPSLPKNTVSETAAVHSADATLSNVRLPVVESLWRPNIEPSPVLRHDVGSVRQSLSGACEQQSAATSRGTVTNSSVCSQSLTVSSVHESAVMTGLDKHAVTTPRSKTFDLANFLPSSDTDGTSAVVNPGMSKTRGLFDYPYHMRTELTNSSQANAVLSKTPPPHICNDSFYSGMQDDLSLIDNDLSVFLNDPDFCSVPVPRSVESSGPFWNAGIAMPTTSKAREKSKDVPSQYVWPGAPIAPMHHAADQHRMDWISSTENRDRTDFNSGAAPTRNNFDVPSLTGKTAPSSWRSWPVTCHGNQQSVLGFPPVYSHNANMRHPVYSGVDSGDGSLPANCQMAVYSNPRFPVLSICTASSLKQDATADRQIFSIARHALPAGSEPSSAVISQNKPNSNATTRNSVDTRTVPTSSLWSPCISSSHSGAAISSSLHPVQSSSLQYRTYPIPSTYEMAIGSETPRSGPPFTGFHIHGRDMELPDALCSTNDCFASSVCQISHHPPWIQGPYQSGGELCPTDIGSSSVPVSLSFRPQIDFEVQKQNCQWPEDDFDPFSSSKKRSYHAGLPAVENSMQRTAPPCSSSVPHLSRCVSDMVTPSSYNLTSSRPGTQSHSRSRDEPLLMKHHLSSCTSNASFALPVVSASVSGNKLPQFSFATLPPVPDLNAFGNSRLNTAGDTSWNPVDPTPHFPNSNSQPFTFAISSQLTCSDASANETGLPGCATKRQSPSIINIHCQQKNYNKPECMSSLSGKSSELNLPGSTVKPHKSSVPPTSASYLNLDSTEFGTSSLVDVGSQFSAHRLNSFVNPPLHHPPVTSVVGDCSAKHQLNVNNSFTFSSLAPAVRTFSTSTPFQPTSGILGSMMPHEIYSGLTPDNGSFFSSVFLADGHESQNLQDSQVSNKTASSKKSPRSLKSLQPMQVANTSHDMPTANAHLGNTVQLPVTAVDMPTYLVDSAFVGGGGGGFMDGVVPVVAQSNDCQIVSSLATVFKPPVISSNQPMSSFSFQTSLTSPALSSFSMTSSQPSHLHNFDFGMIFSDFTNSPPVIMPPIQTLRLHPPVPPPPPPPAVNFLPGANITSSLQQQSCRTAAQPARNSQSSSSSIHNLSINSLLGRSGQSTLLPQNQMDLSWPEKFHS